MVKKLWKRNQIMITALALMIAVAGYLQFTGKEISDEILVTNSAQFEDADGQLSLGETGDVLDDELAILDISDEDISTDIDIASLDSDATLEGADYLDATDGNSTASTEPFIVEDELFADNDAVATNSDSVETGSENIVIDEVPGEAVFTSTTGITTLASANLIKEQTRARNKETLLEIINSTNVSDAAKQQAITSMIEITDIAEKECSAEILLEAKGFADVVVSISGETVDVMVGMSELTDAQRAQIEDIIKRKTGVNGENIIISPVGEK